MESQLFTSYSRTRLPVVGLHALNRVVDQGDHMKIYKPRLLLRQCVALGKLTTVYHCRKQHPYNTTHRTWRSLAGIYMEPPSLHCSVFGAGSYSVGYEKRKKCKYQPIYKVFGVQSVVLTRYARQW